jgi:hypothetical protein
MVSPSGYEMKGLAGLMVYTYTSASLSAGNASGLRVAQSVDGEETTFAWDTALPLAQVMATSDGALDLYGLGRIGELQGGEWAYPLPDALGSVRQWTGDAGNVDYAAGYTPYGEELWQAEHDSGGERHVQESVRSNDLSGLGNGRM